jgi:sugar phosphate permease
MENSAWPSRVRLLEKRRWLICLPLALAFIIVYFHRFAVGVVADNLMRDFAITQASQLGFLSSLYFYIYAALQIPAGISADYWGPRRTITVALGVTALGTFLFAWAPSLDWLFAARVVIGVGVGFIYINIVKVFATWFRSREFGTMSGLSSFTGNLGFALAATPLAAMVEIAGWRASFNMIALSTLLVGIYCWLAVRDKPADYGWPSIGEVEAAEGVIHHESPATDGSVLASIRTVVTNPYTWPPFVVSTTLYGVYVTFAGVWGVPYLMQIYGLDRVAAAGYMVTMSLGYMLVGPVVGWLSDRLRSRRLPFIGNCGLLLATWLAFTFWNGGKPPAVLLHPLCFFLGAGAAGITLNLACAKEVNPPHLTGLATGFVNIGPFIGAAVIQPLFGFVLDLGWQGVTEAGMKIYPLAAFQMAFMLCAAILALALAATFTIKETACVNIAHRLLARRSDL